LCVIFFFFQAEDGIRDRNVTGVQTCALPIFRGREQVPGGRGRVIGAVHENTVVAGRPAALRRGAACPPTFVGDPRSRPAALPFCSIRCPALLHPVSRPAPSGVGGGGCGELGQGELGCARPEGT